MPSRALLPLLALGLGLVSLTATPAPAADKADKPSADKIAKLVAQLGDDDFDAREKASAVLDAVGEPALDALRLAVKSTDEEVHKRASMLVAKIEKRLESVNALTAKHVHLVYKDTPVQEAVEDFKKKSGFNIALSDPENKLKGRTLTLDTGEATFWQAFDQFCEKAGLKEGDAQDSPPAQIPGIAPAPLPVVKPPLAAPPAAAPLPTAPPINVGPGGVVVPPGGIPPGALNLAPSDQITLVDGKPESGPTDSSSAVRVRALAKADAFGAAPDGELLLALRLSLEPRLQWQSVDKVTIKKAVDDQKQELAQLPVVVNPGGIHQDVAVHLKKGDKAAKSLTELSGTISAQILGEETPFITASEILKAAGKSFKGGENGLIKIADVTDNGAGQIVVRLELQAPTDVVPANAGPVPFNGPFRPRPIRRVPVQPVPGGAAVPPGALAPVAGAAIRIAIAPGAIAIGPGGWNGQNASGLTLQDDKGAAIKQTGSQIQFQSTATPNGVVTTTMMFVLTFQAEKGQEASKLVYLGRKMLSVEIPFTLKDVPLP